MRFLWISCLLALSGCGVKAPPVAPERPSQAQELKLNCSVYDPECDRRDPNYDPAKDPAKQQDEPADEE